MIHFGSVCSGIEAASAAWLPLGWECQFMSEIEAFPRAVLSHRFPETSLHGDFTTIQAGDYGPIDLLVGGTPCQSFSVAGLRGGMADARGNLALEYLRLADRLRPRWVVWENVPGVLSSAEGRDFGAFVGGLAELGYGWAYRILDAQYFGLAQRRKRVFVVGCLGDWRGAVSVLFEPASLRGDSAPGREAGEGFTQASGCGPVGSGGAGGDDDSLISVIPLKDPGAKGEAGSLRNSIHGDASDPMFTVTASSPHGVHITHTLSATGFDASEDGTGRGTPLVALELSNQGGGGNIGWSDEDEPFRTLSRGSPPGIAGSAAVRRLTPRECERLQGFPDDHTLIPWRGGMASDGPRYKAIGNSMAVPVMRWIGRRIEAAQRQGDLLRDIQPAPKLVTGDLWGG